MNYMEEELQRLEDGPELNILLDSQRATLKKY